MTVTDLVHPIGNETPIEATSGATPLVDALTYVKPTATGTVEQFSPDRLLVSHGRRECAERAVVMSQQPVAVPTAPMPAPLGELKNAAYSYWLTIALAEPLATATPASFQLHVAPTFPSPLVELLRHYRTQVEPQREEARAYRTFVELADWLGMTQEDAARLLGMGRTTPLAWRRGHEPQPARARRLYQTHALVGTLVRRIGREGTLRWLAAGDPAPLNLIRQGDVTRADDLAEELIFGAAPSRERLSAWVDDSEDTHPPAATPTEGQPRRVRRRPPRRRTR